MGMRRGERGLGGSVKLYTGLAVVVFYIILGTCSMFLSYRGPLQSLWQAEALAPPEWTAILSPVRPPPTIEASLGNWALARGPGDLVSIEVSEAGGALVKIAGRPGSGLALATMDEIYYPYAPAKTMFIGYNISIKSQGAGYSMALYIVSSSLEGKKRTIQYSGERLEIEAGRYTFFRASESPGAPVERLYTSTIRLPSPIMNRAQEQDLPLFVNPVKEILLEPGTRLRIEFKINYTCSEVFEACGPLQIYIRPVEIKILGLVHGIMGTDSRGSDILAQFIEGARVANVLGLAAAGTAVIIGILVGSLAGLRGGRALDHVLTFATDTVFLMPAIPLIMIAITAFGRSLSVLYALMVLVSWPGMARLSRSWVMALRAEPHVEAAAAMGAGELWIFRKHVLSRLAPLAAYGLASSVPSVIATEVLIQLIGFGDPNLPSWGKMLNEAYNEGALINGAWWWLLAPIAGISSYMAGFVLIGLAMEERFNPRLSRT